MRVSGWPGPLLPLSSISRQPSRPDRPPTAAPAKGVARRQREGLEGGLSASTLGGPLLVKATR